MGRKALFLVVVAVWLSWRAVPTAYAKVDVGCGDGICQTISCAHSPGDPGNGCEESTANCEVDCPPPNPCDNPHPYWVPYSDNVIGAYSQIGFDGSSSLWYCDFIETHEVVYHDLQNCVAAREDDIVGCYYLATDRRYEPHQNDCCFYNICGGTGPNCP